MMTDQEREALRQAFLEAEEEQGQDKKNRMGEAIDTIESALFGLAAGVTSALTMAGHGEDIHAHMPEPYDPLQHISVDRPAVSLADRSAKNAESLSMDEEPAYNLGITRSQSHNMFMPE